MAKRALSRETQSTGKEGDKVKTQNLTAISISIIILLFSGKEIAAQVPPRLLHSLFNPSTNAQAAVHQGYSVATDGNFIVVGIPGAPGADNVQERNSGAVKVYDATTGALLHTLKNPTPPPPPKLPGPPSPPDFYPDGYDNFGHSVAISGTLVVVGAPYARVSSVPTVYTGGIDRNAAYRDAGTAYIYDLAGINPTEPVAALNSPEPEGEQHFGYSVAISGRNVVVGAPNHNAWSGNSYEWGSGPGTIYLYGLTLVPTPVAVLFDTIRNPNPSRNYYFGYSVAMSGAAAAVAAPFGVGGTNAGTVYLYDIGDRFARSVPVAVLTNPNTVENDGFGASVAITGTRVLVGAPYDDTVAFDAGNAYVYEYSLDRITPTVLAGTLTSPAPAPSGLFAYSVSASGDLLAVGTYLAESAYIYDFASLTPTFPAATLSNPTPATDDRFGNSVAVLGTRVLVGAPYDDTQALDAGSAYLFDLASPAPTTAVATLDDPILEIGGNAGKSVAVSGNTVVVVAANETYVYDLTSSTRGAPLITLNAGGGAVAVAGTLLVVGVPSEDAGTTRVYDLANAAPTEPIIILTNPAAAGSFGSSVAISGTQIAVGAPFNPFIGGGPGSVYVYDLLSVTPALPVVTLNNPVGHPSFGWSVSLSDTRVVVGAPTEDESRRGRVYVYHLASATPAVPVATLNNPLSTLSSHFGWSVSLSGARAVVGAPYGDQSNPGVAYVYDLGGATPTTPLATLNQPGAQRRPFRPPGDPGDLFGHTVAISGARVVVGAPYESTAADSSGAAYVYDLASATPTTAATVFNPSTAVYDVFGIAVAVDGSNIVVGAPGDDTNGMDQGAAHVFQAIE
jgi:hypothetical protein